MHIPKLENAYENIQKACELRLQELYPIGVPDFVQERYEQEMKYLETCQQIDDFEILRLLHNEAVKCSQFLSVRGTTTCSYIVYLLTKSILNPLPTHYYCPSCGHYEIINTKLFGMDLPDSNCPQCNTPLIADGFNLASEMFWDISSKYPLSFEYNISEEFLPFAKRLLDSLYPNNVVAPLGIYNRNQEETTVGITQHGFLILPAGQAMEDYPEMTAYLENGDLCLTGNILNIQEHYMHRIYMHPHPFVHNLVELQRKTGLYANEITQKDLRTLNWNDLNNTTALTDAESRLFYEYKPKTFYDMVSLACAGHNTYKNTKYSNRGDFYGIPEIFNIPEFKKYPCYTRDDFFDSLIELGYDREKAYEISRFIRMGKQNSCSQKFIDQFEAYDLPEDLKTVAKQFLYIFPRSHGAEYVLLFARLAYYAKKDSRAFSKVIYKKR